MDLSPEALEVPVSPEVEVQPPSSAGLLDPCVVLSPCPELRMFPFPGVRPASALHLHPFLALSWGGLPEPFRGLTSGEDCQLAW